MDAYLTAISAETLASISFGETDGTPHADTPVGISLAAYGDQDVSQYDGFDLIVARYGKQEDGSILKARFAALLRRQSDGAIRLIRHWARDYIMETSIMVPHERRQTIVEAFSTHDPVVRRGVLAICEAYERTDATAADIAEHDAATMRELAWHVRRAATGCMTPRLSEALMEVSRDMSRPTYGSEPTRRD